MLPDLCMCSNLFRTEIFLLINNIIQKKFPEHKNQRIPHHPVFGFLVISILSEQLFINMAKINNSQDNTSRKVIAWRVANGIMGLFFIVAAGLQVSGSKLDFFCFSRIFVIWRMVLIHSETHKTQFSWMCNQFQCFHEKAGKFDKTHILTR